MAFRFAQRPVNSLDSAPPYDLRSHHRKPRRLHPRPSRHTMMFIACGQDAGSVAKSAWAHLSTTLNQETKNLKLSLFFPSLPVGIVGGGAIYASQKASLELLKCRGPGSKRKLAGLVTCFSMALGTSAAAAIASGGFTNAHKILARDKVDKSKL
ncbi:substrate-binding domain of hmg-CoA reductase [Macroventuria anomochaeta]|uniref:Substrate-binding domain of hmg-CoA reductase n=1 Tax=Macroventuria anomochaeta TaxID=301207 RepID=A0ACB6SIP3_9PLEO|nr:substrate-binding domain of hmg-CoA reductase [Macroventuria anomochaeta]KAF2633872.1 substrate-binding domain of hmg-CoA reductase [Macroventuria anomochaeta]